MLSIKHAHSDKPGGVISRVTLRRPLVVIMCLTLFFCLSVTCYATEFEMEVEEAAETDSSIESTEVSDQANIEISSSAVYVSAADLKALFFDEDATTYTEASSFNEFMEQPVTVSRYEYELLKSLQFIQYALAIVVALIFLLIFRVERRQ